VYSCSVVLMNTMGCFFQYSNVPGAADSGRFILVFDLILLCSSHFWKNYQYIFLLLSTNFLLSLPT
jgi:hypothetical protein